MRNLNSDGFTTLRISDRGAVLYTGHRARLGNGATIAFDAFVADATPGVYALHAMGDSLRITRRRGSSLVEGIATRLRTSPLASQLKRGPQSKPSSPCVYDELRTDHVATLLVDHTGNEIFESCRSAVIAWDGRSLVLVPDDRPRVASLAEQHIAATFPHRRAPLLSDSRWALLLVNAVGLFEPAIAQRERFPGKVRAEIADAIESTAWRPPPTS